MTIMLPTGSRYAGSLTDVVPSSLAAMGVQGFTNTLSLPASRSVIVVLVDGLGAQNLKEASGHARFLSRSSHLRRELVTVYPSTTAAALISLMTGVPPGVHGVAGYKIRDPRTGRLVNQLTELDTVGDDWMRSPTLAEKASASADVFVVGRSKFAHSPMTRVAYRGATYVSADKLEDRVIRSADLAKTPGRLVVLYISELDSTAHKYGVESLRWRSELEEVDGMLKSLHESVPADTVVLVTADHGIVDVQSTQQIILEDDSLLSVVAAVGGEPRCVQLFLDEKLTSDELEAYATKWQVHLGNSISVRTRNDVIASGILGANALDSDISARLGDLFLVATNQVAVYDGRDENRAPRRMVGQHGSLSAQEMVIPLIQLK